MALGVNDEWRMKKGSGVEALVPSACRLGSALGTKLRYTGNIDAVDGAKL